MKNLTLKNLAEVCKGQLFWGASCKEESTEKKEAACVVLDSRKIEAGGIFLANEGANVDGHKFIGQVFEKGALGVICEKTPQQVAELYGVPAESWGAYILVQDSLQALKDIAEYYREQLSIPVIGITGSVGKTSTKEFIAGVLAQKYNVLKTEGNFNNEIGLPLTLLRIRKEHEAAVVEMGISDFGEMHRLSKMAKPDICVITNIGQCHLENLKSREGILKAKTEIFDFMSEDGYVCVNGADDMLATLDKVKGKKVLRFGVKNDGCECFDSLYNVYGDRVENLGLFGSKAVMHLGKEAVEVTVPLPGVHMVINATAAALVAQILDLSTEQICKGIAAVEAVGGRSNIIRWEDKTVIDDCYNANPVSMKAAIDLLMTANTRKVAVLGDMFELGENSDEMHAGVGRYGADAGVDLMICVGENSKHMYEGVLKSQKEGQEVYYFETREALLENLKSLLKEGDTVLVKASHGMGFDKVVEYLQK
ncbi:MAG: UDP-N-acetylmuramoyl-tripeptide--D-alanyl-D-alanine ligase [Lachnospiraceae bacterium]|nr:UDP-N-acetylmuramoyl-tripeptide--D-alanyl-D-alanine ligase [Lachnospiraceae bacterium]